MDSNKDTLNNEKSILKKMQTIYATEHTKKILEMLKKVVDTYEFEVSINRLEGINMSQYIDIANYMNNRARDENNKSNLVIEETLDISYGYSSNSSNNYRITIVGEDKINRIMSDLKRRKNHTIFSILTNNIINQSSNEKEKNRYIFIIHKIKNRENIIDLNEYDIRIRLSQETDINKQIINDLILLSETERNKIIFRFKERLSYTIPINNMYDIRIDLTNIRQNMVYLKLEETSPMYELELEIIKKGDLKVVDSDPEYIYGKLLYEIYRISQVLQKSTKIITTSLKNNVYNTMNQLLYNNAKYDAKDLPFMPTASLENQHVASDLTNNYCVTDKADGERYFMLISNGSMFLISNTLEVKEIDGSMYQKTKTYDNTILDGEYIFLKEQNKFLYLVFDILFYKGKDLRDEIKLENRLEKINDVMKELFNVKNVSCKYVDSSDYEKIMDHYKKQIVNTFDELSSKLKKQQFVVMSKTFFIPSGLYQSELYAFSDIVWTLYTMDKTINCPYTLDGLIYSPLNQKYTRSVRDIKYPTYKWKPASMNSIDFYVKFERDPETNQILNVYDNSSTDMSLDEDKMEEPEDVLKDETRYKIKNQVYNICNLHVGSTKTGVEQPVLFDKENGLYLAYLYLQDGEPRDKEGNIIEDGTVVEFAYKNNPMNEHPYNWIPLRTRFDKTESVIKYQRKYGNNEYIAPKIWRSMLSPVELNDIKMLADEKTFDNYMKTVINPRVTKDIIMSERAEKKYYELDDSKLSKHMRTFHNFIKTNLISTFCSPKYLNKSYGKLHVLDIGAGRGGDLMKYFHARVGKITCFDPDYENVFSTTNGLVSRLKTHQRKIQYFPETVPFIADGKGLFNLEDQLKVVPNMSDINKDTIRNIFGLDEKSSKFQTFEIISCQFMLHYLFETDLSLNNFVANVNKFLKKDGYLIITMVDGDILHKSFQNDKVTHYYVDGSNKKILFEYKKLYSEPESKLNKTGLSIDFYNASFMSEGTYITEYLVTPKFLIDTIEEKCNMTLLDTDTFENQFNIHKDFLEMGSNFEANLQTRDQFNKILQFYNMNLDDNEGSYELMKLNRYYVFQKK